MSENLPRGLKTIIDLEKRARNHRNALWAIEVEWDERMKYLRERYPAEWKEYCEKTGRHPRYDWSDLMA